MAKINSNDYYYDLVRKNIKKYRKEKEHTLQSLSEAGDMSMNYLAEIESEKRKESFSIAILGRIADTLEIDIREFFNE